MPDACMTKHFGPTVAAVLLGWLALATPTSAQFKVLETEDVRVISYGPELAYLVPHTARCFENALGLYENRFHYQPWEKVTVLLTDFKDQGNAAAGAIPNNLVIVSAAPFNYVFETSISNERMSSIANHELIHVMASDNTAARERFYRKLFGGKVVPVREAPLSVLYSYLTTPRLFSARWYHEGIAVSMESWGGGGIGRSLGSYDEMVFRTLVHDNARIYDVVSLEAQGTKADFQALTNAYLYGTRFFSYLGLKHGPESLVRWVSRDAGSQPYFAAAFQQVYGKPVAQEWNEWIDFERGFQKANLEAIRANPVTRSAPISDRSLGAVSNVRLDRARGKVYVGVNYPGQVAHLAAISLADGSIQKLTNVKGPNHFHVTSLAFDEAGGTLFFTTDNNDWRDLKAYDVATGKVRGLMVDARVGDLAFNPVDRSVWGVRHYNDISTLVRIPPPYTDWKQIHSWPYGIDLYNLDISPDGTLLAAALTDIEGNQKLVLFQVARVLAGDVSYETVADFSNSAPESFVFSSDGRFLYGSSYYSGVSNLYRYEVATKEIKPLSNAETGLFRPLPVSDDKLFAFNYTASGFVPVLVANSPVEKVGAITYFGQQVIEGHPIAKQWKAPPPSSIDLTTRTVYEGPYSDLGHLGISSFYPVVEGYKSTAAVGARLNLTTPVGLHAVDLTATYSPDGTLRSSERWHLKLNYSYMGWLVSARLNPADFYDLVGPTKAGYKGYSLGLKYRKVLLFDEPNRFTEYSVGATGYGDLDRIPGYQNVAAPVTKLVTVTGTFEHRFLEQSLGAVEDERGYRFHGEAQANVVSGKVIPMLQASYDYGIPLPISHSTVWLGAAAGWAHGDLDDPFANFYFGAFGNNWIDYKAEKRFRTVQSFPGYEIDELKGQSFGKALVEWSLPPLLISHLGTTALYATWVRASVFSAALATDLDDRSRREYWRNVGVQLDLRLVALSHHQVTLSLGTAVAAGGGRKSSREVMASLKIL